MIRLVRSNGSQVEKHRYPCTTLSKASIFKTAIRILDAAAPSTKFARHNFESSVTPSEEWCLRDDATNAYKTWEGDQSTLTNMRRRPVSPSKQWIASWETLASNEMRIIVHTSERHVKVVRVGVVAMVVPPMCLQLACVCNCLWLRHSRQPPRQQQAHRVLLRPIWNHLGDHHCLVQELVHGS